MELVAHRFEPCEREQLVFCELCGFCEILVYREKSAGTVSIENEVEFLAEEPREVFGARF